MCIYIYIYLYINIHIHMLLLFGGVCVCEFAALHVTKRRHPVA